PVVLVFPLPSGVVHCAFTSTATHMNSARINKLAVPATYSFTRDEEFISTISSVHRLNGFGQLQLSLWLRHAGHLIADHAHQVGRTHYRVQSGWTFALKLLIEIGVLDH